MRKSVTSQTEKALVAYVQGSQADTPLATVTIYAGGLSDVPSVIAPPSLILTASEAEQMNPDCGIYELKLRVCLATQVDDEMDAIGEDIHRERIEALRDLLEDVALVQAYVNPPDGDTDGRTVKNFTLSSIIYQDDETKFSDRKIVTDLSYYVCASPSD